MNVNTTNTTRNETIVTIMDQHRKIKQEIAEFAEAHKALAERFHDFLSTGLVQKHHAGYSEQAFFSDYEIDFYSNDENGIRYYFNADDYDGMATYHFVLPYDYIADPDGWEAKVHEEYENTMNLALEIYRENTKHLAEARALYNVAFGGEPEPNVTYEVKLLDWEWTCSDDTYILLIAIPLDDPRYQTEYIVRPKDRALYRTDAGYASVIARGEGEQWRVSAN